MKCFQPRVTERLTQHLCTVKQKRGSILRTRQCVAQTPQVTSRHVARVSCAGDKRASDSYQSRTIPSNTIESKLAPTSTATNRLSGLIPKQYRDHYWNAVRVLGAGESVAASNAKPPLGLTTAASPNGACDQAKWLKSLGRSRFLVVAFFVALFGLAVGKTLPRSSRANVSRRRVH
jgi:hypothetical protein